MSTNKKDAAPSSSRAYRLITIIVLTGFMFLGYQNCAKLSDKSSEEIRDLYK